MDPITPPRDRFPVVMAVGLVKRGEVSVQLPRPVGIEKKK